MANSQYVGKHFQSFAEMIAKRNQKRKFCSHLLVKIHVFYGGGGSGWGGGAQGSHIKKYLGEKRMQMRGKLCQDSLFKSCEIDRFMGLLTSPLVQGIISFATSRRPPLPPHFYHRDIIK